MRFLTISLFLFSSLVFVSCGDTAGTSGSLAGKTILLASYGSSIEYTYFKVWSDSTWEQFGRITNINGTTYATIVDDGGYEYFYSADGYAGFGLSGGDPILFDEPIPSLPDTVVFGKTYTQQGTFTVDGTVYTLKIEQTLQDTGTVTVGFGTFYGCVLFKSKSTMAGGGQSNISSTEFWMAQGPSELKKKPSAGTVTLMVYGHVNGQDWGTGLPKRPSASAPNLKIEIPQHLFHPMLRR